MANKRNYFDFDTIAAPATAIGGALCVIRVSGSDAHRITSHVVRKDIGFFEDRRSYRVSVYSNAGKKIEDGILIKFSNPLSFTGEDCVELHIHGGGISVHRTIKSLLDAGATPALPGEFSFRALKNGKMTLSQVEAVSDLIGAQSELMADLALGNLDGRQEKYLDRVAKELRSLASLSELGIDFSDQDIEELSLATHKERLNPIVVELRELERSFDSGNVLKNGVPIVLVGEPNAGKSSLFNSILGLDRSIVTPYAGTTRDVVSESLLVQGSEQNILLRFEDTAGIRSGESVVENDVERIGIDRSRKAINSATLVFNVIDSTQSFSEHSARIGEGKSEHFFVLTKIDLARPEDIEDLSNRLRDFGAKHLFLTSSKSGAGLDELIRAAAKSIESKLIRKPGELVLTRRENADAVGCSLVCFERALAADDSALFASDIREGLSALSRLIGDTVSDDILERIFSEFCIGK